MKRDDHRGRGRTARDAEKRSDVGRARRRDAGRELVEKRYDEERDDDSTRKGSDSFGELHGPYDDTR
jgi:hypothetical protein